MKKQEVKAPTLEHIEAQLNQLILQRAQIKDQLEAIEKQMPVLHGIAQVLRAQAEEAKPKAK